MESAPAVLLSWSSGKDSALALDRLARSPEWRVARLLTTLTEPFDRVSMHGVRRTLLEAQAAALGLPLTTVSIPPAASNETYEDRMATALAAVRAQGIHGVAFGDLFLQDVRHYRERLLAAAGMGAVFPLWGLNTHELARSFVEGGYRAVLTCVDTEQLPADFAGRDYDRDLLRDLPSAVDPCGENGEFHTFVHDGPLFLHPVIFGRGERVLRDDRFMYQDLF